MTALTHDLRIAAAARKAEPKKGFWARVLDRVYEARMRQVEREVRMHMATLHYDVLKDTGFQANYAKPKRPFVK